MDRKYIGVDLGAWYNKDNKTSIAVGIEKDGKLLIENIYKEYTVQHDKIKCIHHDNINGKLQLKEHIKEKLKEKNKVVLNAENWNKYLKYDEKNIYLAEFLTEEANENTLIGIDAPFGVPYYLFNPLEDTKLQEEAYNPNGEQGELANQYIFDNSARFVHEHTKQKPLAPAGDKIGKMTARMVHLAGHFKDKLHIRKAPIEQHELRSGLHTFEVFPTATLYCYIQSKLSTLDEKYLEAYSNEENTCDKFTKIISYKNKNWNRTNINRMLKLIEEDVDVDETLIKTDDDYDAVICALTTYLIAKDKYGYIEPKDKSLFKNSFIYMPNIPKVKS